MTLASDPTPPPTPVGANPLPPTPVGANPPLAHRHRPWWIYALRVVALLVVATVVVAVLRGKLPTPATILGALRSAHWGWVAAALALELASIGMIIRQQCRLLGVFGTRLPYRRVGAITYSSTALSLSLPAGAAVGAGWSFRQFRRSGASSGTAAAVLVLSGLISTAGLVLLYLAGLGLAAVSRLTGLGEREPLVTVLLGVAMVAVVIMALTLLARRVPRPLPTEPAPTPRLDDWQHRHPHLGRALRQLLATGRETVRIDRRNWRFTLGLSAANWGLDILSLYASCRAVEVHVDFIQLGAIYLGIQLIRQIPITPGGIGLIEAALLAALVAQHVPQGAASAAVVIYRLFSAWLIVPIGFVFLALLRRARTIPPAGASPEPAAAGPAAAPTSPSESRPGS